MLPSEFHTVYRREEFILSVLLLAVRSGSYRYSQRSSLGVSDWQIRPLFFPLLAALATLRPISDVSVRRFVLLAYLWIGLCRTVLSV